MNNRLQETRVPVTRPMVAGLLVTWLAVFVFAEVWWLFGMPYPVPIDVFGFLVGFVALCGVIIKAERTKKSKTGSSQ